MENDYKKKNLNELVAGGERFHLIEILRRNADVNIACFINYCFI